MPEIDESDALKIAREYYTKTYGKPEDAERVVARLKFADIAGLVIYAYNQGVSDKEGE